MSGEGGTPEGGKRWNGWYAVISLDVSSCSRCASSRAGSSPGTAACSLRTQKIWGDYSGTRLRCDEYPFASTYEGSLKGNNRFSVRLIESTDNEAGGRMLDSMYIANRVLDGDPFYVKITS
jgi:hypothetical protein